MSKGSQKRKPQVPDKQVEDNWALIFAKGRISGINPELPGKPFPKEGIQIYSNEQVKK